MKKLTICISILSFLSATAQTVTDKKMNYDFDSGLIFKSKNNNYNLKLDGFIQPVYTYDKIDNQKGTNEFNVKHSVVSLSGNAVKEKISFKVEADFSLSQPLLDAWIAYHPIKNLSISAGQKLTPLNNREMTIYENRLSFSDRSLLSTKLSETGREFGAFLDWEIGPENFKIVPP